MGNIFIVYNTNPTLYLFFLSLRWFVVLLKSIIEINSEAFHHTCHDFWIIYALGLIFREEKQGGGGVWITPPVARAVWFEDVLRIILSRGKETLLPTSKEKKKFWSLDQFRGHLLPSVVKGRILAYEWADSI